MLLQISGFTLVFIKFSQFSGLLYFSCFSFVLSSERLVLTILSTSIHQFTRCSFRFIKLGEFSKTLVIINLWALSWRIARIQKFLNFARNIERFFYRFSYGFLVALLVRITHFVSFPLTRSFILSESFHCRFHSWNHVIHRRWRLLLKVFQVFQTLQNMRGLPSGHHTRASHRIFSSTFTRCRIPTDGFSVATVSPFSSWIFLPSLVVLCEFRTLSARYPFFSSKSLFV